MNTEDGQVYSVCILQFSCFTKYNRMQSKHKQTNVNIADETLTYYSFLSRYHYTKSKNYLKRRYRIRHWIPMFFGTPCNDIFRTSSIESNLVIHFTACCEENITRSKIPNLDYRVVPNKHIVVTTYISSLISAAIFRTHNFKQYPS